MDDKTIGMHTFALDYYDVVWDIQWFKCTDYYTDGTVVDYCMYFEDGPWKLKSSYQDN